MGGWYSPGLTRGVRHFPFTAKNGRTGGRLTGPSGDLEDTTVRRIPGLKKFTNITLKRAMTGDITLSPPARSSASPSNTRTGLMSRRDIVVAWRQAQNVTTVSHATDYAESAPIWGSERALLRPAGHRQDDGAAVIAKDLDLDHTKSTSRRRSRSTSARRRKTSRASSPRPNTATPSSSSTRLTTYSASAPRSRTRATVMRTWIRATSGSEWKTLNTW